MIKNNIRMFRAVRGETQIMLSEKVGISVAHLNAVEKGRRDCSMFIFEAIAQALETTPAMLLAKKLRIVAEEV